MGQNLGQQTTPQMTTNLRSWETASAHLRAQRYRLASKVFESLARSGFRAAEAWFYAGNALERQGNSPSASACYRKAADAIESTPRFLALLSQVGFALLRVGVREDAEDAFGKALAVDPQNPEALIGRGICLLQRGDCIGAAETFRAVPASSSDSLRTLNLIQALMCAGLLEEARAAAEDALANGEAPLILAQYVRILAAQGVFEEAERVLEKLRRLDQAVFDSLFAETAAMDVVGRATLDSARYDKTNVAALYAGWHANQLANCQWRQYGAFVTRIQAMVETALAVGKTPPMAPHLALNLPFSAGLCTALARSMSILAAEHVAGYGPLPAWSYPPRAGRLRVGYVSGDIRDHATAHLIRSLPGCHDRDRVEVFMYSLTKSDGSEYALKIRRECDHFADCSNLTNREVAQRIHDDGIHILVDLQGHTRCARMWIFAFTTAPVQVTWLAFAGSVGADYIPYALVDSVVAPPGSEALFSETLVSLPECYQVNDRWQPVAKGTPTRAQEGLPAQGFVFACFNNANKLEPDVFDCWMEILKQTPGSVLWLYKSNEQMVFNLRREASARGVAPERLVFAVARKKPDHLARLQLADLFLDTFIYNAHTTASDSLWAGVPVLTWMGERFASRVAASLLYAVGLDEMVMPSRQAYLERAVQLAHKPETLAAVRQKLAENKMVYPLFDTERFARHLEDAYDAIWAAYEAGGRPARIDVPARAPRKPEVEAP